jgi:excisionase family DNA binding protein
MSEAVASALIAAAASVTGSILVFIVAMRSVRRSVSSSDGVPIGRFVDTRLGGVERRLEHIEGSLSEVRELLAYQRGRGASALWSPTDRTRT